MSLPNRWRRWPKRPAGSGSIRNVPGQWAKTAGSWCLRSSAGETMVDILEREYRELLDRVSR
ncbi:MAG: hypothetical protein L6W00_05905 [Lentisphaeria bacterium]|nr:MAG: hypothetical protein L6W00_05905 [Lentisphaeria bacterium]